MKTLDGNAVIGMLRVVVPHPLSVVSVTVSATVPELLARKKMFGPELPPTIVPPVMVHTYVEPGDAVTEAGLVDNPQTLAGALIAGPGNVHV